jgi:hypothetical protein
MMTEQFMNNLQISPHFMEGLLGQYTGNHIPPAEFRAYDNSGSLQRLGWWNYVIEKKE